MSRLGFTRKDASLLVINEVIPLFNQSTEVISPPINWSYFTPKKDRGPQLAESQEHQAGYQTQFRPHAPWRICSWILSWESPKLYMFFPRPYRGYLGVPMILGLLSPSCLCKVNSFFKFILQTVRETTAKQHVFQSQSHNQRYDQMFSSTNAEAITCEPAILWK